MNIEISIKEIQVFLNDFYNIDVELKNVEDDKIKVTYFGSIYMSVKEVKEDSIMFKYEINDFLNIVAQGAHFFQKKQLEIDAIQWNSRTKEIAVDLKKVKELNHFLKFLYISDLSFGNGNVLLVLNMRNKE